MAPGAMLSSALASTDAPGTLPQADARVWLSRSQNAAARGNYRGTLVFSAGGEMSSSRVWHYCVGDQVHEQLEALDGHQHRMVRSNDEVRTVWPRARVAVVEGREPMAAWSTTPQAVDPRAADHYRLRREGAGRVAGRDAEVLLLEPRDAMRYPQRLWADQASGLVLRADVLAVSPGRPALESSAFSEVDIGVKPPSAAWLLASRKLDGYRVVRPPQQRTDLASEGWMLVRNVPGFTLVGCRKKTLDPAGDAPPDAAPVIQAMFTDGLAYVSMFIEPVDARRPRGEAQTQLGATGTVVRRREDHWITVVGDVPAATLSALADALARRR